MAPKPSPITVPKALLDESLRHQVNLGRYQTSVVHNIIGLLNDSDKDLVAQIAARAGKDNFTTDRLTALLEETRKLIKEATDTAAKNTAELLTDFASHEAEWGASILNKMTFSQLDIVTPTAETLAAIVTDVPFQGALLHEWYDKLAADKQHGVTQQLRLAQAQGETTDQMVARIAGTKAGGYEDGVLAISRRHAEAVARTATSHTANNAQQLLYKENDNIMQGWVFLATLDGRTTLICASLSGTKWPVGEGPIPPRHFRCRSFSIPLLKTWKELGINIDEIPPSTRASVGGQVPADMSYSDWLKTQPQHVQDDMLGKARGQLFRDGGLTVDKFTDSTGNIYSLEELKAKEAPAFKKAFGEHEPTHFGGGHGGSAAPVAGPLDFSHIMNPNISPEAAAEVLKAKDEAVVAKDALQAAKEKKAEYMKNWNAAKKATAAAEKALAEEQAASAQAAQEAEAAAAKAAEEAAAVALAKAAEEAAQKEAEAAAADQADTDKKWKMYKSKIKPLMVDDAPLPQAFQTILGKLAPADYDAFMAQVADAKATKQAAAEAEAATKAAAEKAAAKVQATEDYKTTVYNLMKDPSAFKDYELLGSSAQHLTPEEQLKLSNEVTARLNAAKAAEAAKAATEAESADLSKKWNMYKSKIKSLLKEDKPLTPAFQKVWESAPVTEKEAMLKSVGKQAQVTAAKAAQALPYDMTTLEKEFAATIKDWYGGQDTIIELNDLMAASAKGKQALFEFIDGLAESPADADVLKGNVYKAEKAVKHPSAPVVEAKVTAKEAEKTKEVIAAAKENKLLFKDMEKLEAAKGSNEGGLYLNKATGEKWYIKTPASADTAVNEVVANHLYELAGVKVPITQYIDVNGRLSIASKWVEGIEKNKALISSGKGISGIVEGFGMDAWLANWDVVGLSYDNLLLDGKAAVRIDNGGSLLYRAQGGLKGDAFGSVVHELDTLRNASLNPQSASVFAKMTEKQLEASVLKVLQIADSDIAAVVNKYGAEWTEAQRKEVIDTLIARKQNLMDRFPGLLKEEAAAAIPGAGQRVTDFEVSQIKASRINGYVMPTDAGMIEDHSVLVWNEFDAAGNPVTKIRFKLTGDTFKKMEADLPMGASARPTSAIKAFSTEDNQKLSDSFITAIKGIAKQVADGAGIRQVDIDRVDAVKSLWKQGYASALSGHGGDMQVWRYYQDWMVRLESAVTNGTWDFSQKFAKYDIPMVSPKVGESKWVKDTYKFEEKKLVNGRAQATGSNLSVSVSNIDSIYKLEADGIKTALWGSDAPYAMQGTVELSMKGEGASVVEQLMKKIGDLGINSERSTALDREELYLRQIAYARSPRESTDLIKELNAMPDQAKRIKRSQDWLSEAIGKDVTKLPNYNPAGSYQAFGQGRLLTTRPDLEGKEWDTFTKEYRLYHGHTSGGSMADVVDKILGGGGQMAPTTDKLRRGIPLGGMSPTADLDSGGANYFFTRIKRATNSKEGFYWKSDAIARLDAISYDGDMYGRTTGTTVRDNRISDISGWKQAAGQSNNETIFKNSFSMFDGLDKIVVGDEDKKQKLIDVFTKHGYSRLPDGRFPKDIIKVK